MTDEEILDDIPLVFSKREIYDCLESLRSLSIDGKKYLTENDINNINFCIEVLGNYGRRDLKDFEEDD